MTHFRPCLVYATSIYVYIAIVYSAKTFQIIFSSLYEVLVRFTRDFDGCKHALLTVDDYDKTDLRVGLLGVCQLILEEWGNGIPCQVGFTGIP